LLSSNSTKVPTAPSAKVISKSAIEVLVKKAGIGERRKFTSVPDGPVGWVRGKCASRYTWGRGWHTRHQRMENKSGGVVAEGGRKGGIYTWSKKCTSKRRIGMLFKVGSACGRRYSLRKNPTKPAAEEGKSAKLIEKRN